MPFSPEFIASINDGRYKKTALLFNQLPTSPGYIRYNMPGMNNLEMKQLALVELAKISKAETAKDERGFYIVAKLQAVNPHPGSRSGQYTMAELTKISTQLRQQSPTDKKLAKAIDEYQAAYYNTYRPLNKPGGFYDILVGAQLLMESRIPHTYDKSTEFQSFMLQNIVHPIINIYAELETRSLQAKDAESIRELIKVLHNNLGQFVSDAKERYAKVEGDEQIVKLRKMKIESEILELSQFVEGVENELNHICDKIVAVETHAMTKQLKGRVNDRDLKKAERSVVRKLNQDASESKQLDDILQSKFREFGQEKAQQHHGFQVLPFNQSKLPEMGSSYGLCYGYSSQFLDVISDPGYRWANLSNDEKNQKFAERLSPNNPSYQQNRTKMNLEAGLKFDAQFIESIPEAISKDVKASKGKTINLSKELPEALIEKGRPNEFLIAIYSETGGHALGYSEDQSGTIWFHDSNSGLYSFSNKKDFSEFMTTYMKRYYSEYDQRFSLYDYQTLKQKADLAVPQVEREKTVNARFPLFNNNVGMRKHFSQISEEEIKAHYDKYIASGRVKSENDEMLIAALKEGFSKISEQRNVDQQSEAWLAFALVNTLKRECIQMAGNKATPAFVKVCDDYLDKIASLINPQDLQRNARNQQFIADKFAQLGMALVQQEPSIPLRVSNENLRRQQARPNALSFNNLRKPETIDPPQVAQPTRKQGLKRKDAVRFTSVEQPVQLVYINEKINKLEIELAKSESQNSPNLSTSKIIVPLIEVLHRINNSTEPAAKKIEQANDALKKASTDAMMTAGGVEAVEIIQKLREDKPLQTESKQKPNQQ